ncbi:hypothetical protein BT96DRAFT_577264 [Gymnopus androsaceus JB14]|uniref:Uncharacterized protein n=1 Tax=Gymnopus androsaceus JB14 TaxID=1447944 RepID=A0A6A4HVB2_9AGAR|nr:hypothetical protein BT96DRAFT_577264 [Gymnopus androsaceus JB14]
MRRESASVNPPISAPRNMLNSCSSTLSVASTRVEATQSSLTAPMSTSSITLIPSETPSEIRSARSKRPRHRKNMSNCVAELALVYGVSGWDPNPNAGPGGCDPRTAPVSTSTLPPLLNGLMPRWIFKQRKSLSEDFQRPSTGNPRSRVG